MPFKYKKIKAWLNILSWPLGQISPKLKELLGQQGFACQTYSIFFIYAYNLENHTHMYLMPIKCWQPQILYICELSIFLHIHHAFSIPCLAGIFLLFCKCLWNIYCNSLRFHIWQPYLFLHILWPLIDCLWGRHISFSLFMPISSEIVHMCIYTKY